MSARELEPLRTLIANLRKLAHEWPDKSDVGKAYSQGLLVSANKLEALLPALESALAARAAEPSESAKKLAELITRNCVHTDGSSFDEHVEKTAALLESFARSYHAAQSGWSKPALGRLLSDMQTDEVADRIPEVLQSKVETFATGEPSPAELVKIKLVEILESFGQSRHAEGRAEAKPLLDRLQAPTVEVAMKQLDEHFGNDAGIIDVLFKFRRERDEAISRSKSDQRNADERSDQARADALREAARKLCMRCELDGDPRDCINDSDQPRDGGPRFIHIDSDGSEHECVAGEVWAISTICT